MSDRLKQNSGSAAAVLASRSLPVGIWITSNYIRDRDLPLLDLLEGLRLVRLEMQMARLRTCETTIGLWEFEACSYQTAIVTW